jgi:hypothetical protein
VISRFTAGLICLVIAVPVVAAIAKPAWANSVGLDVWNLPQLHHQIEVEQERDVELNLVRSDVLQRIDAKERLMDQLLAGKLTLGEVAEQFMALDRDNDLFLELFRRTYPGETDEERIAYNVIEYALPRIELESFAGTITILARMEHERRQLKSEHARTE